MKKIFCLALLGIIFPFFVPQDTSAVTILQDDLNPFEYTMDTQIKLADLGRNHTIFVTEDERVFTVGFNDEGQLGDGTNIDKLTPTEITHFFNLKFGERIKYVSAGEFNSALVTSENRMFTWGRNDIGQLMDLSYVNSNVPIDVTDNLTLNNNENIEGLTLGNKHALMLTSSGRVLTWGNNTFGELGNGDNITQVLPVDITDEFSFALGEIAESVVSGIYSSALITSNGRLFTWGNNDSGILGSDSAEHSNLPIDITSKFGLSIDEKMVDVSFGFYHTVALTSEGRIFTWGMNTYSQLGQGAVSSSTLPTEMTTMFGFTNDEKVLNIESSGFHTIVYTNVNRIYAWGHNPSGQLGVGTTADSNIPMDITSSITLNNGDSFASMSAFHGQSSVLTKEGKLFMWGHNLEGQLGNGTRSNVLSPFEKNIEVYAPFGSSIIQTDIGVFHSIALTADGDVFAWGKNDMGQLGDGTTIDRNLPTEITNKLDLHDSEKVIQVEAGKYHSGVLTSEGRVMMWGLNNGGYLGDGTLISRLEPVDISDEFLLDENDRIIDLTVTESHAMALSKNGHVFSWGTNGYGQLGDNSNAYQNAPINITDNFNLALDETIVDVEVARIRSMAISSTGRVFSWGSGYWRTIGNNSTADQLLPLDITQFFSLNAGEKVDKLALGTFHSSALTTSGRVFMWGRNTEYQLGNGGTSYSAVPVLLTFANAVIDITAGGSFTSALDANSDVFTWGSNLSGQLGTGDLLTNPIPEIVTSNIPLNMGEVVVSVNQGNGVTAFVTNEGRLLTVGENSNGELGDGSYINKSIPVSLSINELNTNYNSVTNKNIVSISSGTVHSSVVTEDGSVFIWGQNESGQLGDGTFTGSEDPINITSRFDLLLGERVIRVETFATQSAAITSNGRLFTWGANHSGQLGDGTLIPSVKPIDITTRFNLNLNESIIDVGISETAMGALTSEGRIFTWGVDIKGILGNGGANSVYSPTEITSNFILNPGETINSISFGNSTGSAITSGGQLFTWGGNSSGILGNGTTIDSQSPINITNQFTLEVDEKIIDFSVKLRHSLAVTSKGKVFTWGNNDNGKLGDGTEVDSLIPINITSNFSLDALDQINSVSTGYFHSVATTNTGKIFTWGVGDEGQLGTNSWNNQFIPVEITSQFSSSGVIVDVVSSVDSTLFYTSEGEIFGFGNNYYSVLGIPGSNNYKVPTQMNPKSLVDFYVLYTKVDNITEFLNEQTIDIYYNSHFTDTIYFVKINDVDYPVNSFQHGKVSVTLPIGNSLGETVKYELQSLIIERGIEVDLYGDIYSSTMVIPEFEEPTFDVQNQAITINEHTDIDWTTYILNPNDNSGRQLTLVEVDDNVIYNTFGTYSVTVKVMDQSGNETIKSFDVTVTDVTCPTFDNIPDQIIESGVNGGLDIDWTTYIENVQDNLEDNIDTIEELSDSVDYDTPGKYSVTVGVTDGYGNQTTQTFEVEVRDTLPPVVTTSDIYISLGEAIPSHWQTRVYAFDLSDTGVIIMPYILSDDFSVWVVGQYSATGVVLDSVGNSTPYEITIHVIDITPPTFDFTNQVIEIHEFADIDWTTYVTNVADDSNALVTLEEIEDNVVYDSLGEYTVTVKATDESGNETSKTITVSVSDLTPPTFEVIIDQSIFVNDFQDIDWTNYINNASDNLGGVVTFSEVEDNVLYDVPGTYTVTVKVEDESGNETIRSFQVEVEAWSELTIVDSLLSYESPDTYMIDFKAIDMATGGFHTIILTEDGRVLTFGKNESGQLGDGSLINSSVPINIIDNFNLNSGERIIRVFAGSSYSGAITSEYRVFMWGNNAAGQLGDGTITNRLLPTLVDTFMLNENEVIIDLEFGDSHTLAKTSLGELFVWGNNDQGQLGNNSTMNVLIPLRLSFSTLFNPGEMIADIETGHKHSGILTTHGRVFMWGYNGYDQLGNDGSYGIFSPHRETTPQNISEYFSGAVANLSLSGNHSFAETTSGLTYKWGSTVDLTQDTPLNFYLPLSTYIFGREYVTGIDTGSNVSIAFTSYNKVYAWGNNEHGQLGVGNTNNNSNYNSILFNFPLTSGESILDFSFGEEHAVARTTKGRILTYGDNTYGQLGDGTVVSHYNPVALTGETYTISGDLSTLNLSILTSYNDFKVHQTTDHIKLSLIPSQYILDDIESIKVNGIDCYNIVNHQGRIDIYVPNTWTNLESLDFIVTSIKLTNGDAISLNGEITTSVSLVPDVTPPTFDDITNKTIEAGDFSDVDWTEYMMNVQDNLGGLVITTENDTVDYNTAGTYVISVSATDVSGNKTTKNITVNVTDTTSPTNAPISTQTIEAGLHTTFDWASIVSAYDNSDDILSISEVTDNVVYDTTGSYVASVSISDNEGNETIININVDVVDTTGPTFNITDTTIDMDDYSSINWTTYMTDLHDFSEGDITLIEVEDNVIYDVAGEYTVIVKATDSLDNETSKSITVTVIDTVPPTFDEITILEIVGGDFDVDWTTYMLNVLDNSSGNVVLVEVEDNIIYNKLGQYSVTVKAVDASGNETSQTFHIWIYDAVSPTFDIENQEIEAGEFTNIDWSTFITNMQDNLDGPLFPGEIRDYVDYDTPGTYTAVVSVGDESGFGDWVTIIVTVVDSTPPTFTVEDQIIEASLDSSIDWSDYVTNLIDNSDDQISFEVVSSTVDFTKLGEYTVELKAEDLSGNSSTVQFNVIIQDTTAPELTVKEYVYEAGVDIEAMLLIDIADNSDDFTGVTISLQTEIAHTVAGIYEIDVTIIDENGNEVVYNDENAITLTILDSTSPTIEISIDKFEAGLYPDFDWVSNLVVSDNATTEITLEMIDNTVDFDTPGLYMVSFKATDISGQSSTKSFDIEVIDTTSPEIVLNSDIVTSIEVEESTFDCIPAVTVTDNSDSEILITCDTTSIEFGTLGQYDVLVTATDESGNSESINVKVNVVDTTSPTFDVAIQEVFEIGELLDVNELITNISDNHDMNPILDVIGVYDLTKEGTYLITFSVEDASGNMTNITKQITMMNPIPLLASLANGLDTIYEDDIWIDGGVIIDNGQEVTISVEGDVGTEAGTYEITYNVTDLKGETVSVKRFVTVLAKEKEVTFTLGVAMTTLAVNETYEDGTCSVLVDGSSYNCVVKSNNVDVTTAGVYTIVYSYQVNENEHSCVRYVHIIDDRSGEVLYYRKEEEGVLL